MAARCPSSSMEAMGDRFANSAGLLPYDRLGRLSKRHTITNGMLTLVRRNGGGEDFRIAYPASELERMAGANGLDRSVRLGVSTASGSVFFGNDLGTTNRWLGRTNLAIELTGFDASLTASVARLPPTAAQWISILLPILMLLGSAVVGWLLVYRLFSRQLGFLTRQLDAYKPGAVIESGSYTATGAVEVIALGRALQDLSEIVANKIADVSTGLARQTTLTREVHHRVKNNLQVIASLISLHSRAAETVAAKNAYVTIQRRVDALSVVQRSHHAETETPTGISLNALVRELAQSFEATLDNHGNANVSCNMIPAMVTQDTATSIAFLLTELLELAFNVSRYQPISIIGSVEHEGWCLLRFQSDSYLQSDQLDHLLRDRYGRVLMGLSRQLRRELHYDKVAGILHHLNTDFEGRRRLASPYGACSAETGVADPLFPSDTSFAEEQQYQGALIEQNQRAGEHQLGEHVRRRRHGGHDGCSNDREAATGHQLCPRDQTRPAP